MNLYSKNWKVCLCSSIVNKFKEIFSLESALFSFLWAIQLLYQKPLSQMVFIRLVVKKTLLWKENREKGLNYGKLCNNWTDNQMQQILGRYKVKSEISHSNHHQYETQGIRKAGHSVSIASCKTWWRLCHALGLHYIADVLVRIKINHAKPSKHLIFIFI